MYGKMQGKFQGWITEASFHIYILFCDKSPNADSNLQAKTLLMQPSFQCRFTCTDVFPNWCVVDYEILSNLWLKSPSYILPLFFFFSFFLRYIHIIVWLHNPDPGLCNKT